MKPILVTSGEPAGIGPDICLSLSEASVPLVVIGDIKVLQQRAKLLGKEINCCEYTGVFPALTKPKQLFVLPMSCPNPVIPGQLDSGNAPYVVRMLTHAVEACVKGDFSALVTAPIHKGIINQANIPFTGHTEFLADFCNAESVVMMLACKEMKVALATTHLALEKVPEVINKSLLTTIICNLHHALIKDFAIKTPRIFVAGLNPHAGEDGYLGRQEIDTIIPVIKELQDKDINVSGPYPADTMFCRSNLAKADVFLAMYHDQGLSVLKYASFGHAVNITLGLPIIRTSVDHGTALSLAGTGNVETNSMHHAIETALSMIAARDSYAKD